MVLNRITLRSEEPEERARAPDYWLVQARSGTFAVSAEVAARIKSELRRFWRPRWIRFVDLSGSEIQLASKMIEMVGESRSSQRAFDRMLRRALEAEDRHDTRSWED